MPPLSPKRKPAAAKDLPPQPGDDEPVDPKNPGGPTSDQLFGRLPAPAPPAVCVACDGCGRSTNNLPCVPCGGTGRQGGGGGLNGGVK